jgi:predicted dehydrogenase
MGVSAIVVGSGWAGEGHTLALRAAGVDVVAICGRTETAVKALVERLEVREARLNWAQALSELRPDIVAIATPAGPHREIAETAAGLGCHIFCDKPLAVDSASARAMLSAVRQAKVKHAYGASSCLAPVFGHVRSLVASGLLGTLTSIEFHTHFGLARPTVYSWFHDLTQGGGMLNQIFTHALGQVIRVTEGVPKQVTGEAKCLSPKVPVGPPLHDFRQWFSIEPNVEDQDPSQWQTADADTEYAVMIRFGLPPGGEVTARFYGSLSSKSQDGEHFILYGTKGTLVITGRGEKELHHYDFLRDSWTSLPITAASNDVAQQGEGGDEQHNWNRVFQRFVADVRGEPAEFYPTFEDGWLAAEIIEAVRAGKAWADVPAQFAR